MLTPTHSSHPFTIDCQSKARLLQSGALCYCTLFIRTDILALRSSMFTSTIQCPPEIEVKIRSRRAGKSNEFNAFQFVLLRAFLWSKIIRRHYFSLPLLIRCDSTNSCRAVRPHSVGMSDDFRSKTLQLKQGNVRVRTSGDVTAVVWNDTRADKYS